MAFLSATQISEIIGGELRANDFSGEIHISSISIDSRTIFDPARSVFFALKTERNDGHRYLKDLYFKGVKVFVVSEYLEHRHQNFDYCIFILVPDTLKALQKLASWQRSLFHIPVVGITGSNGKTIVKEWLFDLLQNRSVLRSPKSYNSQVGVPLSVWNLLPDYEIAIFEAGISKPGEMQNLFEIIKPTIGILTNIGEAHQENFKSHQEKLDEKLLLFKSCKTFIYCLDQPLVRAEISKGLAIPDGIVFAWSFEDETADLYFRKKNVESGVEITTTFEGKNYTIELPFIDAASMENAGHCLALILSQHWEEDSVLANFSRLQPVAMRLEMKEGINGCLLINDYYNSDINSLQIALSFLNNHASHPYVGKTVILSDIQQAGIPDVQLYSEVARLLSLNKVNHLIGIGSKMSNHAHLFELPTEFYPSTNHFLESIQTKNYLQECILLKGARDFHFELISAVLQKKYHQTVLEIDLNAMIRNLNSFWSQLDLFHTQMMVMVKAFSYGSGLVEIARILQYYQVDYLAVAVADEGVELRQAGINLPIVVMNPEEHSFETMIEFRLEPNIYSEEILHSFQKVLKKNAVAQYPIHIKLDTGMSRLGFNSVEKIELLVNDLEVQDDMVVRSVFSHLAAADDPAHDEFTLGQIKLFEKLSALITEKLPYPVLRHILNSAGIERFPEYQFEMVRLGIGLYGVSSCGNSEIKSISRLKTSISQIRKIDNSQTVGYGRKGIVTQDSEIAVLPIGYADGYDRRLSNGVGKVYLKGRIVPIIGNVCMDMCMIDVTGLNASVGDEVELMGDHIQVSKMAEEIGTIPYEILTGISQRVKRVYLQE